MYAERKGLPLERVAVRLSHDKIHAQDCADYETKEGKLDEITRIVKLSGALDDSQRGRALPAGDRVIADEPALAGPHPGSPGDAAMAPRRDVLPVPELGEVADAEHTHRQIGDADVAGTEEAHDQQEIAPPAERRVAPHEVDGRVAQPGRGLVAAGLDAEHHWGSHRVGSFGHDART